MGKGHQGVTPTPQANLDSGSLDANEGCPDAPEKSAGSKHVKEGRRAVLPEGDEVRKLGVNQGNRAPRDSLAGSEGRKGQQRVYRNAANLRTEGDVFEKQRGLGPNVDGLSADCRMTGAGSMCHLGQHFPTKSALEREGIAGCLKGAPRREGKRAGCAVR